MPPKKPIDAFATIHEAVAAVGQKRAAHLSKMEARYTLADGIKVFAITWSSLFKEHFSTYPPVPISPSKHVPRLKRQIVQPLKDAGITVSEFTKFLFENWHNIRRSSRFAKFKYYPEVPAIDWILKFSDMYVADFMDYRGGTLIEQEPVITKTKDVAPVSKIVNAAKRDIEERDREIARLRAENKSLQLRRPRAIKTHTAKPKPKTSKLPEWD